MRQPREKKFVITRFDPDEDEAPKTREYTIPVEADWKVLDALNFIKDEVDATLSHRWSCRMAVCGSCGMMVDGEPKLTCRESLSDCGDVVEVAPLSNFPVIRDLVVDIEGVLDKFRSAKPWIIRAKELAASEGPLRQSPEELEDFKQFSMCINCMLCYAACPVVSNEPEFIGPAAIALGHRYSIDSRDEGAAERNQIFRGVGSVFSCSFANECSEVCPKHVDPAAAVNQAKVGAAIDWARDLVLPRRGEQGVPRAAHPHAVQPKRPARTRTAPPARPPKFPFSGRYRAYTLFDWTGLAYLLLGFLALRAVWALGSGEAAWNAVLADFENPLYVAFHALALASVIFAGVRFFRLFPKAQPPRIGPFKPPPRPLILGGLYAAWIGITAVFSLVLAGAIFR